MPGLKQLKKFAQDIDALGNEANRRVEKSETLPVVEFPTNISEADDSEEFIFGLPEQSDSTASENIDIDSSLEIDTNIDSQDDVDVESLLASVAQERFTSPVVDITPENQDNIQSSDDFTLPGLDDGFDLSALDDFDLGSTVDSVDNLVNSFPLEDLPINDDISKTTQDVLGDDLSESNVFDFTPENLEMDFTPENVESVEELEEVSELASTKIDEENPIDLGGETDFSMPDFGGENPIDLGAENDFSMPDMGENEFTAPEFDSSSMPFDIDKLIDVDFSNTGDESMDNQGFENLDNPADDFDSFSDFDLVPPEVPQEVKKKHISFSSGKGKKEEILSTELTEAQYKTFLENLNYYHLNLRFAI